MKKKLQRLSERFPAEAVHFGLCPYCAQTDGCLNIKRTHFFYCQKHRAAWFVGSNLFPSWRLEDEATWRKNDEFLRGYEMVEPIWLKDTETTQEQPDEAVLDL